MQWIDDDKLVMRKAESKTHLYYLGQTENNKTKLLIKNKKTKKEKIFNIFNTQKIFQEEEAECIIKREEGNI